jgi:hypothetical protein
VSTRTSGTAERYRAIAEGLLGSTAVYPFDLSTPTLVAESAGNFIAIYGKDGVGSSRVRCCALWSRRNPPDLITGIGRKVAGAWMAIVGSGFRVDGGGGCAQLPACSENQYLVCRARGRLIRP